MDIEQVKKFNSMVKTLTKQGFVDNNDAAFEIASNICEKGKPPEMPKKENKMDESELKKLIEQRVEQHLYVYKQRFENALSNVSHELQKLIINNKNELDALKKQMKKKPVEKEVQEKIPEEKSCDPHPRQGCYTSDDVALDKIFYYGQK